MIRESQVIAEFGEVGDDEREQLVAHVGTGGSVSVWSRWGRGAESKHSLKAHIQNGNFLDFSGFRSSSNPLCQVI
jgi:hypothetical protein